MALVAYDYDSASEDEEEKNEVSPMETAEIEKSQNLTSSDSTVPPPREIVLEPPTHIEPEDGATNNLFSRLPQTKTTPISDIVEDQIEDFIPKSKPLPKDKQKVKITIPSLSEFDDVEDDEPQPKKVKPSAKGSGLMSLLPPVKGSVTTAKSFVPNVLNQKKKSDPKVANKSNPLVPTAVRKKAEAKKSSVLQKIQQKKQLQGSDVESDDDIEMPETFDDEMWEKVCGRPKKKQVIQEPEEPPQEEINIAPEPEKPYDGLDNKAFKELVGKTKRPIGNIKLIDINEEEILPEKDLWLAKSLTDPEMAPKSKVEDPVDPTRRKKHHITYLAQQAKANEQDLQNAWAASKNNRLASRAKYGF